MQKYLSHNLQLQKTHRSGSAVRQGSWAHSPASTSISYVYNLWVGLHFFLSVFPLRIFIPSALCGLALLYISMDLLIASCACSELRFPSLKRHPFFSVLFILYARALWSRSPVFVILILMFIIPFYLAENCRKTVGVRQIQDFWNNLYSGIQFIIVFCKMLPEAIRHTAYWFCKKFEG